MSRSGPPPRVRCETASATETRELGRRLALVLEPGDLVVLTGGLGAGKTTFAQGVGAGLGVRGDITSPTFVISRVHPSLVGGPPLVHVDAYRLHGGGELDDLDLDETLEDAVTLVEWGAGVADALASSRLVVALGFGDATDIDSDDQPRSIEITGLGPRWAEVALADALADL